MYLIIYHTSGAYQEAVDVGLRDQLLAVLWRHAAAILDANLARLGICQLHKKEPPSGCTSSFLPLEDMPGDPGDPGVYII